MLVYTPLQKITLKSDKDILKDYKLLHIKTIDYMWDLVIQKLTYNNYDWTIYGLVNDLLCYDNNISMDNIKKIITIYDKFVDLSYNYRRLNINVNYIRDVESNKINYFPSKGLFYDDINFYKSFYVRNCLNYNNNLLKILWVYNTI